MKLLKQCIDRKVIALATRLLPAPSVQAGTDAPVAALLEDPALFPLPAVPANFAVEENGTFHFPSAIATKYPRNNTGHGKFYPAGSAEAPTVLLVHGWNAELHYNYGFPRLARGLNKRGLNAIVFALPYHLTRRPNGPDEVRDFISDDLFEMLLATRQALADIEALLLWARERGAPNVAVWGFSLGAWLAGLHLAHSRTLAAAVLTTPISDLALAVETLGFCFPIRAALQRTPVALDRLNLTSHTPLISPEQILVTEAIYDQFVPTQTYPALAQKWQLPSWERVPQSHISILFSRRCMSATMDWLRAHL